MAESLVSFHVALCNYEFINKKLGAVDEFHRLKTKSEYQKAARQSALAEIAAVLDPAYSGLADARGGESLDDPLFAAARLVGQYIGAEVKPQAGARRIDDPKMQLLAIAKASRLRVRDIALRDEWWRLDNGAFHFAYKEEIKGTYQDGSAEVPASFYLGVVPYRGMADAYKIEAKLRYRVSQRGLELWYAVPELDRLLERAFEEVKANIAENTGLKVLDGSI